MTTVTIHPSQLVISTLKTLGQSGIDATLTADNVQPAVTAATNLLRALGVTTPTPPSAPTPPSPSPHRIGKPEMWARTDMREALTARDIAAVYRILGKYGITQRAIAAATGQSQSEVSDILGGRKVNSYEVLGRIAHGLGVPRQDMGLGEPVEVSS